MECNSKLPNIEFETCKWNHKILKRTLVYHPRNSNKGFAIKGTNIRVSFIYL